MKINLPELAAFLTENKLMQKSFANMDTYEIKRVCEAIHELTDERDGWTPPYVENGRLVIPFNAPLKYRMWQGGQSYIETLKEMGADQEVIDRYTLPAGKVKNES